MTKQVLLTSLCYLLLLCACQRVMKEVDQPTSLQLASLPDYGVITLKNVASNKFMEVAGDPLYNNKFDDEAKLQQWETSMSDGAQSRWQKWHLIYRTTTDGVKYYQIRNLHSGKLIDVPAASDSVNMQIQQYAAFPFLADQQLWRLEEQSDGTSVRLVNKGNGLALAIANGNTNNGAAVVQEPLVNESRQQWVISLEAEDTYRDDEVVRFFNRNESEQGSVAFDQGNSILLSWGANAGKVLWVTQDAWDGTSLTSEDKFPCNYFFSYGNSMLLQPSLTDWNNLHTPNVTVPGGANGRPRQVCTIQPNNTFAWPGVGVEIGDKVYVHCGEGSGLNATNQSLYVFTQNASTTWQTQRTTPTGLSGQTAILYATGMVKAGDGYVYAYGSETVGFGYESYIHVARFPESNPQQWEFFNGTEWTATPTTGAASKVADGLGSSAVSYLNGKYILMTMDQGFNCDANRRIYLATADSPTGPFTERKAVYTISEYFYGQYARYYTPAIHPHFNNGRNELLLTYCLNYSACGLDGCQDGYIDPYYYRVKGIRVPFTMIGL
ncbi:RICIN domain-containing protein [Olivibacter sp. SA151]|uniref:RICIN domain-containing protein n=1 Tax=Olivibacter jilunii TaxID=985016 RepID=UPI003F14F350